MDLPFHLQVRDFMGPQSTRSQSVMGPHPPLQRENSQPRSASMVAPQKVCHHSSWMFLNGHIPGCKCALDWWCQCFPRKGGEAGWTTSGRVLAYKGDFKDQIFIKLRWMEIFIILWMSISESWCYNHRDLREVCNKYNCMVSSNFPHNYWAIFIVF